MHIHTVSVSRRGQLEVGAWYLIRGTDAAGLPIPPQVLRLWQVDEPLGPLGQPQLTGQLWLSVAGSVTYFPEHCLWFADVNIPPHDRHDVHLERVDAATVRRAMGEGAGYEEIMQQKRGAARSPRLDDLLKDLGVG